MLVIVAWNNIMTDSNFYVLRYKCYANKAEKQRRVKALQDALRQLDLYQRKPGLKPVKVTAARRLMDQYDILLSKIGA